MLAWWHDAGIEKADMAVKRPEGAMMWHHRLALDSLPLRWARALNVRRAEVYIRPAREYAWPLVFLDDVVVSLATRIARKYDAMVVETSPLGGCHIWLACDQPLPEEMRRDAQRWLAPTVAADQASISGEHLGRLAGFKNWKRNGTWVNVLAASRHGRLWNPIAALPDPQRGHTSLSRPKHLMQHPTQPDTSASGREWGWVCGLLEAGYSPSVVYARLVEAARPRRGRDAERYAQRTLRQALERTGRTDV
jgi:hypothetical protein